jgi:isopenicillin N synthase-like dioxygenase
LIKDVFAEWEGFFNSPDKDKYLYNNDTQDGLFPRKVSEVAVGYSVKDIKEFFHFYPWGQYPAELSDKTKQLRKQMVEIAHTLLQWVEDNLSDEIKAKLSEPLTKMIDMPESSTSTLMRILHYPPLTGSEEDGAVRAAAHGDINLLTVLVAASQAGLQVKDSEGKWHDVPVDPGMLAVNIGDMLEEATNGYYKSTLHQVINPTDEGKHRSRYSIPLFLHARDNVVLSERYTAGQFLHQRLVSLGIKK